MKTIYKCYINDERCIWQKDTHFDRCIKCSYVRKKAKKGYKYANPKWNFEDKEI